MVNDKKMAIIMLIIIFFVGIIFFWCMLQVIIFMIEATKILPHFLEEGEDMIKGELMFF